MIERVIGWCASHRFLVCTVTLVVAVWGAWAMQQIPLDAYPDVSDVQVIVSSEWPGRSPDLIEDHVTFPIVAALVSAPKVKSVHAVTEFGISRVYVVFDDGTDIYWARNRMLEYIQTARAGLPEGVVPTMGPEATSVGWIFQYALVDETGGHSLDELRSLQDWTLRNALTSVRGVAEVATIGGFVKQFQVNLDPNRLVAFGVAANQVVDAIRANNNDAGGRLLELAGREYMVRVRGSLKSVADIEQVPVGGDRRGTPVRVGDVANVSLGPDSRRGVAELDGRGEVVSGIVVMRLGENPQQVIARVKERLAQLTATLPPGVTLVPVYDRSDLIGRSIATLRRMLVEEVLVVALVVIVFLSHGRSALILLLALPVGVLASFVPMYYFGITSNIMSLGGLALAVGVLVDASIVMVENGYRRVVEGHTPGADRVRIAVQAASQVGRPVFFSLAVMLVSFAPVLLLEGQEGRMFRPLALTKTFAMTAATLLALTVVPALLAAFLKNEHPADHPRNAATDFCMRWYEPALRATLRSRSTALAVSVAVVVLAVPLLFAVGHEFLPPLEEGTILYMPTAAPGLSVTETTRILQTQDRILKQFPEVDRVLGTAGSATSAPDSSPISMVNTTITLKPRLQWRPGVTFDGLQTEMDEALQFAGLPNLWTQPIRGRIDMLSTGIKTPVGIKILGSDLSVIQDLGAQVERVLRDVPGTRGVYAERTEEGYFADIRIDRAAIGRHGLTIQEVEDAIQTNIGGDNIGRIIDGRERYPINVRYQRDFRDNLAALEQMLVRTPAGAQIPLRQLGTVAIVPGPAMIRDEGGLLAGYVYVDAVDTDLAGYVARARAAIARRMTFPPGYALDWSGQYESMVRASRRLRIIIPVALAAILVLLYLTFGSIAEALMVMVSVVYAMTGGIALQWLLGYNFSVAVWVGYIALYGVAVQTGVVMVVYLREALEHRMRRAEPLTEDQILEATIAGAVLRLRPKLMTFCATTLGLLPIFWSAGTGSDVMKPIAAPILGGMVTSAVHVLFITPLIFYLVKRRSLQRGTLVAD